MWCLCTHAHTLTHTLWVTFGHYSLLSSIVCVTATTLDLFMFLWCAYHYLVFIIYSILNIWLPFLFYIYIYAYSSYAAVLYLSYMYIWYPFYVFGCFLFLAVFMIFIVYAVFSCEYPIFNLWLEYPELLPLAFMLMCSEYQH